MISKRKRRLSLIFFGLVCGASALGLALYGLSENINFFYSPSQLRAGQAQPLQFIRAGGLVIPGSVAREPDSLAVRFMITDGPAQIEVFYEGILPDLFREGQGVVAEGKWLGNDHFAASLIMAKHDETYMPPEVAEALKAGHPEGQSLQQAVQY